MDAMHARMMHVPLSDINLTRIASLGFIRHSLRSGACHRVICCAHIRRRHPRQVNLRFRHGLPDPDRDIALGEHIPQIGSHPVREDLIL